MQQRQKLLTGIWHRVEAGLRWVLKRWWSSSHTAQNTVWKLLVSDIMLLTLFRVYTTDPPVSYNETVYEESKESITVVIKWGPPLVDPTNVLMLLSYSYTILILSCLVSVWITILAIYHNTSILQNVNQWLHLCVNHKLQNHELQRYTASPINMTQCMT